MKSLFFLCIFRWTFLLLNIERGRGRGERMLKNKQKISTKTYMNNIQLIHSTCLSFHSLYIFCIIIVVVVGVIFRFDMRLELSYVYKVKVKLLEMLEHRLNIKSKKAYLNTEIWNLICVIYVEITWSQNRRTELNHRMK